MTTCELTLTHKPGTLAKASLLVSRTPTQMHASQASPRGWLPVRLSCDQDATRVYLLGLYFLSPQTPALMKQTSFA